MPLLTLWLGAGFVAETVITNNTPTLVFLNPLMALLLSLLYGPPAALLRDAWVRGRVGWPGLLLAGVAFGALNEGVVANTWFAPDALDFDPDALGRIGGVNWNLVVDLTIFHAFVSLLVPIALVQLAFRDRAGEPWLGRRGTIACYVLIAFVGLTSVLSKEDTGGEVVPDAGKRFLVLALAALAVLAVRVLPRARRGPTARPVPTPRRVAATGAGLTVGFVLLLFGVSNLVPVLVVPLSLVFACGAATIVIRWTSSSAWTARHTIHLIAGVAAPSMLGSLARVTALQPLSTVAFGWFLVRLDRQAVS